MFRYIKYLDFLLNGDTLLHLFLKPLLYLFSLGLVLLLILVKVFDILLQYIIALLQGLLPIFSLVFQVTYLFIDNFMRHRHQKHFLLLLQYINYRLIFALEIFVLLTHLYNLQSWLNQFFVFGVKRVLWYEICVLWNYVLIESLQSRTAWRCLLVPDLLVLGLAWLLLFLCQDLVVRRYLKRLLGWFRATDLW